MPPRWLWGWTVDAERVSLTGSAIVQKGGPVEPVIVELIDWLSQLGNPPSKDDVGKVAQTWAIVLNDNGISGEELKAAAPKLLAENEFFPKPVTVLWTCMNLRNDRALREFRDRQLSEAISRKAIDPIKLEDRPADEQLAIARMRAESKERLAAAEARAEERAEARRRESHNVPRRPESNPALDREQAAGMRPVSDIPMEDS